MRNNAIKSIVIVGGGTAGWSAAACLAKFLVGRNVDIRLVESSQISTVGVGEASIPNMANFNDYVGLKERTLLENTNATFKLGIQLKDWRKLGHEFFHPFGEYGANFGDVSFNSLYLLANSNKPTNKSTLRLGDYSLSAQMAYENRFAMPTAKGASPLSNFGYAYHFDAKEYAAELKKISLKGGVSHKDAKVLSVNLEPNEGAIESIELDDGAILAADLFIDCSGFRALLIEGALQTGYESWLHWLPCDRAVAVPCAAKEPTSIKPYTIAKALSAGWSWRIPLQSRIGNGYVYSSSFLSENEATEELLESLEGLPTAEPNHQRFTPGMRKKFWNKNCVSLGLASGFIEPLESTSINLVHRALSILMDFFPDKDFDESLLNEANLGFQKEQERIRDFIILHYHLSQRSDSDFWQSIGQTEMPRDLERKIQIYRSRGHLLQLNFESFEESSWLTMYEGFGLAPKTLDLRMDPIQTADAQRALEGVKESVLSSARTATSHYEFIQKALSPVKIW